MIFAIHGLNAQVNSNYFKNHFIRFLLYYIGSRVGVQRGCMSPNMNEYKTVKKLIHNSDSDCVKRVNGLDCFKFCEFDQCN